MTRRRRKPERVLTTAKYRPPYYFDAAVECAIRRALLSGSTREEAARLVGISRSLLDTRLRDQLADVRVGRGRRGRQDGGDWDIDEAEIYRRAAEIQARWTEEERESRRVGNFSGHTP